MPGLNDTIPFTLTKPQLIKCMPNASKANIEKYYGPLVLSTERFGINNKYRVAAYLSQMAHETLELRYMREIANGEAYEGRKDLGNIHEGDGIKYPGRGGMMITGYTNYYDCGKALNYDFINHPEDMEKPGAAMMSAGWYWHSRNLNRLADIEAFEKISAKINGINRKTGKPNHWQERIEYYERIKKALGMAI